MQWNLLKLYLNISIWDKLQNFGGETSRGHTKRNGNMLV